MLVILVWSVVEVSHDVCLLLPHLEGLIQFHLSFGNQHVGHTKVTDPAVLLKLSTDLGADLTHWNIQKMKGRNPRSLHHKSIFKDNEEREENE